MALTPARWRVRRLTRSAGDYWFLETGRNETRRTLSLKYVTAEEAERARATMQAEEDGGTISRIFELHERNPTRAVRHLTQGDGGVLPKPKPQYPRLTLREYQTDHYAKKRAAAKPASWKSESGHWSRILVGLGDVRLQDIEPRMFYRWVRALRVEHRTGRKATPGEDGKVPASGAYQRLLRSALQALLTFAYLEGHLDTHVRLGEVRLPGSTSRASAAIDPLDIDELQALMDASDDKHRAMWGTAAGLGLRPSELCRMTWADVNWTDRVLDVRGQKTEDSAATIPMTPIAFRELRGWWMKRGQPTDGLVFPAPGGKPYLTGFKRALHAAARKASIARTVTPYTLRHSFATLAWSFGIDKDTARRMLRHTDLAMLDRVYCHPRPADLVARVAGFDVV